MYARTQSHQMESADAQILGRLPWATLLCALVGLTTPFLIRLAGNFPVSEWILLGAAIVMLILRVLHRRWPDGAARTKWFTGLVVLQVIGLTAYIASDLYRGSAPSDYTRGWARMAFVVIDLIGLAGLIGTSWKRFIVLIAGFAVGQSAAAGILGPLFDDWWKFGFATPITYLLLIVVGRQGRLLASIVALILGVLHLTLEFRSLGLECLLVAVALNLNRLPRSWQLVCVLLGFFTLIAAMSGVFEEKPSVRLKHHSSDAERQAMMEVAFEAFADSPFIGQGSWFSATKMLSKIEARYIRLSDNFMGYTEQQEQELAVHSQLLTALAEGGLFGASFFFAYGLLMLWSLAYCLRTDRPFQALVFLILIEALTNLAITPFSGPARVEIAAATVLGLLLWQQSRGRLQWEASHR